ncbi:MAG: kelch repeat-containing protein, partial [Chloroflexota bacterium]
MTDRELEARLRAWYADVDEAAGAAPADLRDSLAAIPVVTPTVVGAPSRRRGLTLLGIAAVLMVGGAIVVGSGSVRLPSVVPPVPSDALRASTGPGPSPDASGVPSRSASPTPNLRPGRLIAFIRDVDKPRDDCSRQRTSCPTARVWTVGSDGNGARELFDEGVTNQSLIGWSPDGSRLLYMEDGTLFLVDPDGGEPVAVDTGCKPAAAATPSACLGDGEAAFSPDGTRLVFVRGSIDDAGIFDVTTIATMDLQTGHVALLSSTAPDGGVKPGWSPDGRQIVFSRYGDKDPNAAKASIVVIDADGENMHQVNPPTLAAQDAAWSPDGSRIVFLSPNPYEPDGALPFGFGDVYTIRPDGTDVRRLTTGGTSAAPTWTADGRILFGRASATGGAPGWWTMEADGSHAAVLISASALGVAPQGLGLTSPVWQPLGGAAIVPPPWTPAPATALGPPPPTPAPTATPDLAPGFAWTGAPTTDPAHQIGETATLLHDGRVLVTGNCGTAAELYDPATGTFGPTGSLSVVRSSGTATALLDGRVLFVGGYNCASAGQDGMWASAELYDPATGTFTPTGSMAAPRSQHIATLLADGRVLIAGGLTGPSPAAAGGIRLASYRTVDVDSFLASAEIYDPTTGTFSKTGSMTTPHRGHTSTLLQDGRVLVVGNG